MIRAKRLCIALVGVVLAGSPAPGQPSDTSRISTKPLFTSTDAWILGSVAAISVLMIQKDEPMIRAIQRDSSRGLVKTVHNLRYVNEKSLMALDVVLYGVGKLSGNKELADVGLHGAEAIAVASVVSTLIKSTAGRPRPYLSNQDAFAFKPNKGWTDGRYRSFPSLHVGGSFAFATAMVAETRRHAPGATKIYAPFIYAFALAPGLARIYDNHHWPSDVVLGSLIGIYAGAKTVQYTHSHPGNRGDRWFLGSRSDDEGIPMVLLSRRF